jgi:hypothetical protein
MVVGALMIAEEQNVIEELIFSFSCLEEMFCIKRTHFDFFWSS